MLSSETHLISNSLYLLFIDNGNILGDPSEWFVLALLSSLLFIIIEFPFFPLLAESFKGLPYLLFFFL